MNKVILMGRFTADPVLSQLPSGSSVCKFTVAIDRPFTDKATGDRQADFIRCTAWEKNAENIERFFRKGSMIMIEGSIRTSSYQDKKYSDVTHYTTDINVERWEFCGSKSDSNSGSYSAPQKNNNGYQTSPKQSAPAQQQPVTDNSGMSYGSMSDFEEILSDGDVPF